MRLALDPGDTTGYAMCEDNGTLIGYGSVDKKAFFVHLLATEPSLFIVENFKIRPGVNFSWNEMNTIRIIGAIEFRAFELGVKVVFQEPAIKSIGYKWAGIKVPKDHDLSHATDAYAHLVHYNHKVLGLPIPAIQRMKDEQAK